MNAIIDRLRATLRKPVNGEEYQQLVVQDDEEVGCGDITLQEALALEETPFSWVEYVVFLILGIAMLWAW
jgi:equilibrative nucleoside transporter 1/2/3